MRLVTTVVVPQLHDPVMLAKQLATGDMLSGGRLTVGIGVGGRHEDYHAVGADPATQTMRGMAERIAVMKRIWSGDKVTESVVPVGPPPVQAGGPELLIGTMGPKTVRSAAAWADGLAGTTLDLDVDKQNELFDVARAAWAEAGKRKPHLATSFWFALGDGDDARAQMHRHLRRYMNWIPGEYVDAMAPTTGWAGTEEELLEVLHKFADIDTDEIHLIPTSSNIDQLRRVADVAKDLKKRSLAGQPVVDLLVVRRHEPRSDESHRGHSDQTGQIRRGLFPHPVYGTATVGSGRRSQGHEASRRLRVAFDDRQRHRIRLRPVVVPF